MKRALLWLGTLACLTLACLYAYAWFTRDPLVAAFERIEIGMTMEDAQAVMGRQPDTDSPFMLDDGKRTTIHFNAWAGERRSFLVVSQEGRVTSTSISNTKQTFFDKAYNWICDPSSLLDSDPVPVVSLGVSITPPSSAPNE